MGKKSSPPPPDYTGAALAQGQLSKETVNMQNFANRPTINTPFGTESWTTQATTDPATGQAVTTWTQNTTLTPEAQAALDSQLALQQGRSNLAEGFMGRVENAYSKPFDWQNLPAMTSGGGPAQLSTGIADYTPGLSINVGQQDVVRAFDFNGPQTGVNTMNRGLQRGVGTESLQRNLGVSDNPALPAFDASYRDAIATDLVGRMMPVQDQQRKSLETQLSNQGFKLGSEGYKRALDDLYARQASERYNALDMAGNEAQRLYNMQMGQRQQAFNEDVGAGNFYNQAANQAFNQGLAAGQFRNQSVGQAFNQNLGAGQFANQAQNQLYNQQMGIADLYNRSGNQMFQQDLAAQQFNNSALNQASALDIARMQAQNQALGQQFNMNQQSADAANRLRQQAIAEQQLQRGMSLNEMNALLTGQQVGMPQMPSFVQSGRAETPDLLGAANMQYQAALDAQNAKNAAGGNLMGGLFSLGSAAISNPFMFSDRRLKQNIKRVGTHSTGVGLYEYDIAGYRQRGVIAQELEKVRPDLVRRHSSGYLTVNYGAL